MGARGCAVRDDSWHADSGDPYGGNRFEAARGERITETPLLQRGKVEGIPGFSCRGEHDQTGANSAMDVGGMDDDDGYGDYYVGDYDWEDYLAESWDYNFFGDMDADDGFYEFYEEEPQLNALGNSYACDKPGHLVKDCSEITLRI